MNVRLRDACDDTAALIQSKIIDLAPASFAPGIEAHVEQDGEGRFKIVATATHRRASGWDESGPVVDIAPFVNDGTGMFGPNRRMIRPTNRKWMYFFWERPGGARDYPGFKYGFKFMKENHGQKPQGFMERGWRNAMRVARRRFGQMLKK
jgi:hypothetical protein